MPDPAALIDPVTQAIVPATPTIDPQELEFRKKLEAMAALHLGFRDPANPSGPAASDSTVPMGPRLPQIIPGPQGGPAGSPAEALGRLAFAGGRGAGDINRLNPNASQLFQDTDSPATQAFIASHVAQASQGRKAPTLEEIIKDPGTRSTWIDRGPGTLEGMAPQAVAMRREATPTPESAAKATTELSDARTRKERADWETEDARNYDAAVRAGLASGQIKTETDARDFKRTWDAARRTPPGKATQGQANQSSASERGKKPELPRDLDELISEKGPDVKGEDMDKVLRALRTKYDQKFIDANAALIRDKLESRYGTAPQTRITPNFLVRSALLGSASSRLPPIPFSELMDRTFSPANLSETEIHNNLLRKLYGK